MVLSGMSNLEQVLDNTGYMQAFQPLDAREREAVNQVAQAMLEAPAIACTACRYCVDGCPMNIAIPDYFALFNQHQRFGSRSHAAFYYENLLESHGKASSCIGCRQCEEHCPQQLPIVAELKQVAATLEEAD